MSDKYELSRRKALAALGTIGVAGAGAGMGTSALFSDEEEFTNNQLTAGTLDLVVDYATSRSSLNDSDQTGYVDGDPASYSYTLADVKPGDSGGLVFCPKIIDNPGYLWVGSDDGPTSSENGYEEPEPSSNSELDDPVLDALSEPGESSGSGELENAISASVYAVDTAADTSIDDFTYEGGVNCDPNENENLSGEVTRSAVYEDISLARLGSYLESGIPIPQDESAYPASEDDSDQTGPCICIEWNLPVEVGNAVQGDSYSVDFDFVAVQARNNNNDENPFAVEVSSDSELVTALQNSDGITFTSSYRTGLPTETKNGTFTYSQNGVTYDYYDIDRGFDNGNSRAQYVYIRENGQVRLATAVGADPGDPASVKRVFIPQAEDGELVLVLTGQANDDYTLEEIASGDPIKVVKLDASQSP
jgi:predicted ribosomally synthesized peptide with SipW-like signal peptide